MSKPKLPKVTYRQEGGDDGYSYVVRENGAERYNGLNRRQAMYYRDQLLNAARERIANADRDQPQ